MTDATPSQRPEGIAVRPKTNENGDYETRPLPEGLDDWWLSDQIQMFLDDHSEEMDEMLDEFGVGWAEVLMTRTEYLRIEYEEI